MHLVQSGVVRATLCPSMPIRPPSPKPSQSLVVKLQILAAVFVPMIGLAIWLRSQGFW